MAVIDLVPPRTSDLITLANAKALLRVNGNGDDALLSLLIAGVSSTIQDVVLGFKLGRRQVSEAILGSPRTHLILSCPPVEPESLVIAVDDLPDNPITDFTLYPETGVIFRKAGWGGTIYPNWWLGSAGWSSGNERVVGEDSALNVTATYWSGYLLPNDIADWTAGLRYSAGDWVRLPAPSVLRLQCSTAGTSSDLAPSYPAAPGDTVADGSVTWTARTAWELPSCFLTWMHAEILRIYGRLRMSSDIGSLEAEGTRVSFLLGQMARSLAPNVMDGVLTWRQGLGGMA